MSDQDKLAEDYQRHNLGSNNQQQGQQQYGQYGQQGQYGQYGGQYGFNPAAAGGFQPGASSFTPGQYFNSYNQYNQYGGGGYQQQYGGYNNYQQPEEDKTMTLEDYQKQKAFNPPKPGQASSSASGGAAKPKTEIRIGGGAAKPKTEIRIGGGAAKPKTEIRIGGGPKKTEPAPVSAVSEESKPEEVKQEAAPAVEEPKKEEPKKEEPKKEEPKKQEKKQEKKEEKKPAQDPDAVVKEQEALDQEITKELFGADEVKQHMSIIFMGHVDAGKSTIGGHILYLTGAIDERIYQKTQKEAEAASKSTWFLSWLMDEAEERDSGQTRECAKKYIETEHKRISIVDAPGHKTFMSAFITGVTQVDLAVLVLSARKGEFEAGFDGGSTTEHSLISKSNGVNKLIVVVNKMDDPTVEWSKERYDFCTGKLSKYLKTIGFGKNDVVFMPVSGLSGAGLKERIDSKICPWYDGPALLEYLDQMKVEDRRINAPFMMPVASKGKDLGTVVEGKIEAGYVAKNNKFLLMPNRANVEISAVFSETEQEVNGAVCGEQVRLRIKGVEEEEVQPGAVLTSIKNPVRITKKIIAQVVFIDLPSVVTTGYSCIMHIHTAVVEVTMSNLLAWVEKSTGKKHKKPSFAKKGMNVIAQFDIASPIACELYSDLPRLGRFTLRDSGVTIAIGKITKIQDHS